MSPPRVLASPQVCAFVKVISGVSMRTSRAMPRLKARTERVQGLTPAVGIAGIVRLAHAAHQRLKTPAVGQGGGVDEEGEVAAGNEGGRQAAVIDLDGPLVGQGGFADPPKAAQVQAMIGSEPFTPGWAMLEEPASKHPARGQFRGMALAVVEADGLDARIALQGPGETHRQVLSSGEQHKGRGLEVSGYWAHGTAWRALARAGDQGIGAPHTRSAPASTVSRPRRRDARRAVPLDRAGWCLE